MTTIPGPGLSDAAHPLAAADDTALAALRADLRQQVGADQVLLSPEDRAPFERDWRGRTAAPALAVALPRTVADVQAVVRWCAAQDVAIVPQGGNTGLCGGSVPLPGYGRPQLILSLRRLTAIRAIDVDNDALTVEAGVTLLAVQELATRHGRLFPLSLASEGSCCIGGNLATNAGGVQVLRYGNARALVLGLEVVLPDGTLWNGLRGLRKDNTGYDLKQVFLGAEGTLGIITAATLRLFPLPAQQQVAWVGLPSVGAALQLFHLLRAACGDQLSSFELIGRLPLELALRHLPGTRDPLPDIHPWQVLVQVDQHTADQLAEQLAALSGPAGFTQAVIAQTETQAKSLWHLREMLSEAQRLEGPNLKHDIALPQSQLATFIEQAEQRLLALDPAVRIVCFGHLGDGNLHYNLFPGRSPGSIFSDIPDMPNTTSNRAGADHAIALGNPATLDADHASLSRIVLDLVTELQGSISAEHGIGQFKTSELARYRDPIELQLMRSLKQAWDPANRMNPGKVLTLAPLARTPMAGVPEGALR